MPNSCVPPMKMFWKFQTILSAKFVAQLPPGDFGEVDVLVGKGIVDRGLSADVAGVGVKCGPGDVLAGAGIAEHLNRIRGVVPVVVVGEDFGRQAFGREERPDISS